MGPDDVMTSSAFISLLFLFQVVNKHLKPRILRFFLTEL